MRTRRLPLAPALGAVFLAGLAVLLKPEKSPFVEEESGALRAAQPEVYDALHDVAFFTVFGDSDPGDAYVIQGLARLATALEMLARRDGLDPSPFDAPGRLRRAADQLREVHLWSDGSSLVREALTIAAAATEELQQQNYPHLARASEKLKGAAGRLRADRTLVDQHDEIEGYFDAASDLLLPMILPRR